MLGQRCRISPQFYAEAKINAAFIFAADYCHVSDSSLSMRVEIKSLETKQTLITMIRTVAGMDSKTGKSRSLPKRLTERLSSYKTLEKPPPLPVLQLPPSGQYHRWSVRAAPSDMDHMFHINQAVYVRYCMDCASDASQSGFTKHITGDPCFWHVAEIQTYNAGENFPGDQLHVCTWECPDDKRVLKFLIFNVKRPHRPVFHCWIMFRKPNMHKLWKSDVK